MAKALLEVIRQTEIEAQAVLDAAHAEADAMVEAAKAESAAYSAKYAAEDAESERAARAAAESEAAANRAAVLADYGRQSEALIASAEERLPGAVERIVASVTGV